MRTYFLRVLIGFCFLAPVAQPGQGWYADGTQWPAGNIVMNLRLGSAGTGTLIDGNTSWDTVAQNALATWNDSIGSVKFAYNANAGSIGNGDGINTMYWSSTVFGRSFGSSVLAVTSRRFIGSRMTEADITFNTAKVWNSYRGNLRTASRGVTLNDFFRVALHELGHVLGLDHPDDQGQSVQAQMNSIESDIDGLTADDIAGAESLYGPALTIAQRYHNLAIFYRNYFTSVGDVGSAGYYYNYYEGLGLQADYQTQGRALVGLGYYYIYYGGALYSLYSSFGYLASAYFNLYNYYALGLNYVYLGYGDGASGSFYYTYYLGLANTYYRSLSGYGYY